MTILTARTRRVPVTGARRFRTRINAWTVALAAALTAAAFLSAGPARAGADVGLKSQIEAAGPAVTLGDIFTDAGPEARRAVAPAPKPGESARLSARFVAAAAAAAGLRWEPPAGTKEVIVTRASARAPSRGESAAQPVIRRGEMVSLVYAQPGLQISTRGRALDDAGLGQAMRVLNTQSNISVRAKASGPGAAAVE